MTEREKTLREVVAWHTEREKFTASLPAKATHRYAASHFERVALEDARRTERDPDPREDGCSRDDPYDLKGTVAKLRAITEKHRAQVPTPGDARYWLPNKGEQPGADWPDFVAEERL